jgi:uncharacterized protein (DUF1778 family)
MPNQPSPDKAMVNLRLSRELKMTAERAAKARGMTLTDFCAWIIQRETRDIILTPDDYRKIAQQIENARRKWSSSGSASPGRVRKADKGRGGVA